MRTILLREAQNGEWFVGVTTNPHVYHSFQLFETRAQAVRGFVVEGRHQPHARMLVYVRRGDKATVVREGRRPMDSTARDRVIVEAVRTALLMPHLRPPRAGAAARPRVGPSIDALSRDGAHPAAGARAESIPMPTNNSQRCVSL
jgi:hypothetical protein